MKILTCEQTRALERNQIERGSTYFQLKPILTQVTARKIIGKRINHCKFSKRIQK